MWDKSGKLSEYARTEKVLVKSGLEGNFVDKTVDNVDNLSAKNGEETEKVLVTTKISSVRGAEIADNADDLYAKNGGKVPGSPISTKTFPVRAIERREADGGEKPTGGAAGTGTEPEGQQDRTERSSEEKTEPEAPEPGAGDPEGDRLEAPGEQQEVGAQREPEAAEMQQDSLPEIGEWEKRALADAVQYTWRLSADFAGVWDDDAYRVAARPTLTTLKQARGEADKLSSLLCRLIEKREGEEKEDEDVSE